MPLYRLAGREIFIPFPMPELSDVERVSDPLPVEQVSDLFGTDQRSVLQRDAAEPVSDLFGTDQRSVLRNDVEQVSDLFGTDQRSVLQRDDVERVSDLFGTDQRSVLQRNDVEQVSDLSGQVTNPPYEARGWIAGAERTVEVSRLKDGFLLNVQGCGGYFVGASGERISLHPPAETASELDRQAILGAALVFALALRNVWCLHCGAAAYNGQLIAFLGESGMGKSTLSAHLSKQSGWTRVADDLLPVRAENGLQAFPRFPQLKLKAEEQPARSLPESLPLKTVCVLQPAPAEAKPELHKTSLAQTVQAFLGHAAGTRMFDAALLAKHLQFSTQAAAQTAGYRLIYPHRREALPEIQKLLEEIC